MNHATILRTAHAETRRLKNGSFRFLTYAQIFKPQLKEAYRLAKLDKAFRAIRWNEFTPTQREMEISRNSGGY